MFKKALIPAAAAGNGTRGLPITKVLPKEMFPIGLKTDIHYVIGFEHFLASTNNQNKHVYINNTY